MPGAFLTDGTYDTPVFKNDNHTHKLFSNLNRQIILITTQVIKNCSSCKHKENCTFKQKYTHFNIQINFKILTQ